jgi:hypothetical protein
MALLKYLNENNDIADRWKLILTKDLVNGNWQEALSTLRSIEDEHVEKQAKNAIPLTQAEFNLVKKSRRVDAIMEYRLRTGASLSLANRVVNIAINSLEETKRDLMAQDPYQEEDVF